MNIICEYCNNSLSTKSNLKIHQKNNKKCLNIQKSKSIDINSNLKECEYCLKTFSLHTLNKHLLACNMKKEINRQELENKISEQEKIILEQQIKISELQAYKDMYEKDHQVITNMAQQPKTTNTNNNNNNIVNNLAVYDNKLITDRFTDALSNIKPTDLYDGQESISRLIAPCLKNDDGTQLYKCTDYSRGVYVKKDHHGNIIKDINGKNLVELIEPIASKKAVELLEEDNTKRDKQRKIKYLRKHIENQYEEIENVKNNMKGYEINSSTWLFHNDRIKMLENIIERCVEEQEQLENDIIDDEEIVEIFDEKLSDGVDDIKNMKKDSSKFSKKLSKILN